MTQATPPTRRSLRTKDDRHRGTLYVLNRLRTMLKDLGKMYFISSLLMRLPAAMLALSLLILMSARTKEITLGGYGAGLMMLTSALMVPLYIWFARATSDRLVLAVSTALNIPALVFLTTQMLQISDSNRTVNLFPYFAATFLVGVTIPPFGALIRQRWTNFFNDTGNRQTFNSAIALESMMDIIAIPVGALLSGVFSLWNADLALVFIIIIDTAGLYALLWAPGILGNSPNRVFRPTPKPLEGTQSFRWVPLVGIACLGLLLGSTESALAAYTVTTDSITSIGFYLTCLGVGGVMTGVVLLFNRANFYSWKAWLISGITLLFITMLLSSITAVFGLIILLICLGGALGLAQLCMDSTATAITPRTILGSALTFMQTTYLSGLALGFVWGVVLGGRISYQASLLIPLSAALGFFIFGHIYGFFWRKNFEEKLPPLQTPLS